MKKKAIEKIPYFGLKKTSRKKDVKYIGVTAVKIVGHEKHLFLEVYRNKKESKEIPMVRIVLTKKDFGTYWPEKEEWTRQKIKPDSCYGRVIWGEEHPTWEQEKKENILQSTEDLERIKKFCKANVYNEEHWWEYIYKHEDDIVITAREIFDDTAAGPKTWQNHFGGADDEETTVQDTADEPGREETATEAPEPEDDGGAVGETGADDVQEIEKGGMEDHGAADEAGTGQEEDDTDGEESSQADCEEPAERTDEQTGAQSQREEIAPAQKSTETLEKEEVEDDETGENESSDAENQTAESEPETAEREQTEETEVIEAVYGTRKEYMDRLSEQGMAEYMADEYKSHRLLVTDLANTWNLRKWLSEKVDRFGKPMEDAR